MNRFALYLAILALVNLYALALVEWKLSSRHHVGLSGHRYPRSLLMQSSPRDTYHRGNYTKMLLAASAKQGKPSDQAIPRSIAWRTVERLKSSRRINDWMQHLATNGKFSDPPIFGTWGIQDQIEFIKLLQDKGAYKAIMLFLDNSGRQHVKVCTTAVFAMTLSPNDRSKAIDILNKMDQQGVEPTSLTFIALLGSVDGPAATFQMIKRIETYTKVKWNAEIFNSAIYACRRSPRGSGPNDKDWQAALNLFQQMRRKHINPTIKTYHAVLQVLSRTGKVQMAKSILQQLKNTPNLKADDRVWAAAINVCAQAGDYEGAIEFMNEMQEDGCRPNLLHCSALLKAFAQTGQDQMALMALTMMLGEDGSTDTSIGAEPGFRLPPTTPDVVALNTVLTVCSKAGNFEGAMLILKRIKAGDFRDPKSQEVISPDRITYHSLLVACRDPKAAKDIVKEMRLSRRDRYGAVPPNNVTYAHAINVCQKAEEPDLEGAECFLRWAIDDGIQPTVFMYAPAIWAAQRSGDRAKALEYFIEMESMGCRANSVAYNGVISALCDNCDVEHALLVYEEMKDQGFKLPGPTFKRLATSIQSVEGKQERQIYLERIADKMTLEERTVHTGGPVLEGLISAYGSQGLFDEALQTFDTIAGRVDGPCLRAILLACSMASPARWLEAVTILHTSDIVEGTSGPGKIDQIALSTAIIACSKANEFEEALKLLKLYGIRVNERPKNTASISVVAMNALIASCGRGGRPDLALAAFNGMQSQFGVRPDGRSYRSAVIACNQAEHERKRKSHREPVVDDIEANEVDSSVQWWECSLGLLRRMREGNLVPDVPTYSSAISSCEAAGEWQRALGVLQMMMDDDAELDNDSSLLNLYCFNAAISACEKGGAWVEALELYERMLDIGGSIYPNFVTLSSLVVALDNAGQKELAESKYDEGRKMKIVKPWRWTRSQCGESIQALDLHTFSRAMAKAAIRSTMDSYLERKNPEYSPSKDLVIITGKGLNSVNDPVLKGTVLRILTRDYGVEGKVEDSNQGRIVVDVQALLEFVGSKSWR